MQFTNFDMRMFQYAKLEAEKSDFHRFHIGAVIVYNKTIIGKGCNSDKTHPMQKKYNNLYRTFNNEYGGFIKHSIHAEIAAITSIPYVIGKEVDFNKAKIYIYRISPGKKRGYGRAKPCKACLNAIRDLGIKNVYYSDEDGFNYLYLED